MKEIRKYSSAGRMILPGDADYHFTLLSIRLTIGMKNNLGELWSLLNFILPSIFEDLETFPISFSSRFC